MPPHDADGRPRNRLELSSATDTVAVVSLIGEHDVSRYTKLREQLARVAIRAPNVVVNLSQCLFVDSTVISLLIAEQIVITRDGGGFALVIPPERTYVLRLAELMHLNEVLPVQDSLAAAVASFELKASPRADAESSPGDEGA